MSLLDYAAAQLARDAAIGRVEAGADPTWVERVLRVVGRVARSRAEFTTDDVWAALNGAGSAVREPRAMGAVLRQAQRLGWCTPTDRVVPSARVVSHGRAVRVWQSRVYRND